MRINPELRKTVAFIGFSKNGEFDARGTGFLVGHDGFQYFVTAKHNAVKLGNRKFSIRFNKKGGGTVEIEIDPTDGVFKWFLHPDDNVDVAVTRMPSHHVDIDKSLLDSVMFLDDDLAKKYPIGVGDDTYTIGLFRYLVGNKRNLPIVHSGSISLLPSDEKVPVADWDNPARRRLIEAYLVEQQSLSGLSGSPVFVRSSINFDGLPLKDGEKADLIITRRQNLLLGLWQGAWEANPDEILAAETGKRVRVPVGMGVVVPAQKIKEALNGAELQAERDEYRRVIKSEMERLGKERRKAD